MDVIVALVLGIVGLIVVSTTFYARRNDLVYLIRSPAEAFLGVRRDRPSAPTETRTTVSKNPTEIDGTKTQ
jgi:hypothetical protein